MKLTVEDASQREADAIAEAIGCELEISREFIAR